MQSSVTPTARSDTPVPDQAVRAKVRQLLMQSEGFRRLPSATQQQVAGDTVRIASYLAAPEGIPGNQIPGGMGAPARSMISLFPAQQNQSAAEATFQERQAAVDAVGSDPFRADAAREGAKVAGQLLDEVKFTEFVGGLIEGVFHSIVTSSLEQMEAYSTMIASVAQSLQQFMQDNVSENQGRDHMVEKFPDLFEIGLDDWSDEPGPKLKLRENIDENDALRKVNNSIQLENGELKSMDLSDANVEKALVHNARLQLAKQRQQLMASMVMLGINRIVITDGRISAKILYDFRSRDRQATRRSATATDVARDRYGNVQQIRSGEGEYDSGRTVDYSSDRDRDKDTSSSDYSSDYYAKGKYKYQNKPVVTAMSTASTASEADIQTKVQLAGNVEVNFKSDYLPLEKMATPGMIAAIQGNSTPVDPNVIPSARQAPGARNGAAEPATGSIAPPPGS